VDIRNPDNIVFSAKLRTLFIAEDGDMHHNNYGWAYNIDTKKLSRIISAPDGGEVTGLQYTLTR
jgi:secreted PhoX family phosphatase